MCPAQRPQRSYAGEALTHGLSVSSICILHFGFLKTSTSQHNAERSDSVGRVQAQDWGSKGYWLQHQSRWSHCGVSLSKTLYRLPSNIHRKTRSQVSEKLLTGTQRIQPNNKIKNTPQEL